MLTRRELIQNGALAACGAMAGCATRSVAPKPPQNGLVWGHLLHLGDHMWCDWKFPENPDNLPKEVLDLRGPTDYLRADESIWREWTGAVAEAKFNMIVIDLGEALIYPSHPELAVRGSWSVDKMHAELERLRGLGIEPIPKLNFSTTHNTWMKHYRKIVGTAAYREVCSDLIRDVAEIFGRPRFFHIGFDEETIGHQASWGHYRHVVVRRYDEWWDDFLFTVREVEKNGCRAWAFTDKSWYEPEIYFQKMPKSVVQCPWNFQPNPKKPHFVDTVRRMFDLGYDVLPDVGTCMADSSKPDVISEKEGDALYDFCRTMPREQMLGFLFCSWKHCVPFHRQGCLNTIAFGKCMKEKWEKEVGI